MAYTAPHHQSVGRRITTEVAPSMLLPPVAARGRLPVVILDTIKEEEEDDDKQEADGESPLMAPPCSSSSSHKARLGVKVVVSDTPTRYCVDNKHKLACNFLTGPMGKTGCLKIRA